MRNLFVIVLLSIFMLSNVTLGFAGTDEEIQALKVQVQELMQRIDNLETEQAQSNAEVVKAKEEVAKVKETQASRVDLANTLSKLKMKGRWAAGYLASQKAGSYPSGSFEVPEGKIQFAFQPDDINTITMRFNLNNATNQNPLMDYFFLQSKDFLPFLKETPFSLGTRLGRFKLGFGEETLSNNLVESVLPSNSAGNIGLTDEGLEFAGKIDLPKLGLKSLKPLGWVFSVSDGNSGVGSDSSGSKAFLGKFYYTPIEPLYLSTSYYNSGGLKTGTNAEMSIAGLVSPATGVTNWDRTVWEVDARYDIGKGKAALEPIAFSDSKAIIRLSYGQFSDDFNISNAIERNGQFGFVEGTYNLTKKFYTAARYSFVDLDGDQTTALNSITTNKYQRYSLGLGYRWSKNTILKLGYDWNKEDQVSTEDSSNNLISAVVATQF